MQVRAGVIYQEALEATEQILNKRQGEEERWLKEQFPIRSKIHSWLTARLLKVSLKVHLYTAVHKTGFTEEDREHPC